jgi:hypothetical protein
MKNNTKSLFKKGKEECKWQIRAGVGIHKTTGFYQTHQLCKDIKEQ